MAENMPCSGVRVLELGTGAVAPEASRILGELGADVIKIELPGGALDFMRTVATPGKFNESVGWVSSNRNKRSLTMSLEHPQGKEVFRRLVEISDIVMDNHRGGFLARYGLGYDQVKKIRPDVIMIEAPLLGAHGPYANYGGFGPSARAVGGISHLWGYPEDEKPGESGTIFPDHIAGQFIAIAALAALDHRERTGEGQYIDISQAEIVAFALGEYFLEYTVNGDVPQRRGNRSLYAAPHGVYRCQGDDRWVAIAVLNDDQWNSFCVATGLTDLQADTRLRTAQGRLAHVAELDERVAAWAIERTCEEAADVLVQAGVPASIVANNEDLVNSPHFVARQTYTELDQPVIGRMLAETPAWRFSSLPVQLQQVPAPLLGEHSVEVCKQLLGMSDTEIAQLQESGAISWEMKLPQ